MRYEINVVNKHHGAKGRYIGRGSPLGNPWPIGIMSRKEVIGYYNHYIKQEIFKSNPQICEEIKTICEEAMQGPVNLVCYCAPQRCHGDIIKEICLKMLEKCNAQTNVAMVVPTQLGD